MLGILAMTKKMVTENKNMPMALNIMVNGKMDAKTGKVNK